MANITDKNRKKIAVVSTVHTTWDTRIYFKQITSLRKQFDVIYLTPTEEKQYPAWIRPLYKSSSKLGRILTHLSLAYKLPLRDISLYIFHDPELLPLSLLLKIIGRKVIWDMHEDTYSDIYTKRYLSDFSKKILSSIYRFVQELAIEKLDGFILAEDSYGNYFSDEDKYCIIHNYPLVEEARKNISNEKRENTVLYIGSITENRGIFKMIESISLVKHKINNIELHLIGNFDEQGLLERVSEIIEEKDLKENVILYGRVKNIDAYKIMAKCKIGLAVLQPEPNFEKSLPTKLFEYITLGIPVIASNFSLWQEIVTSNSIGEVVDPQNSQAISEKIIKMLTASQYYADLSINCTEASKKYSWAREYPVLEKFIHKTIN